MTDVVVCAPVRTPVGALGGAFARILATLADEMRRREALYGLETMPIGGGQWLAAIFGLAAIFELL
ncbi:MAG: hypothetical protein AB7Q27_20865 [Acidimicrobiia bacterium]